MNDAGIGNSCRLFLSIGVFLHMNGYALGADQVDAIQTITALAAGDIEEKDMAFWIRKNSKEIKRAKR